MTREYGNYEKYEKTKISEEVDKGINDPGNDEFYKNTQDMLRRLPTEDGDDIRQKDKESFEDTLTNENYQNQLIAEKFASDKMTTDYMDDHIHNENEIKMLKGFES
jgi:hypothetical protein